MNDSRDLPKPTNKGRPWTARPLDYEEPTPQRRATDRRPARDPAMELVGYLVIAALGILVGLALASMGVSL